MSFVSVATARTTATMRGAAGRGWSDLPNAMSWTETIHDLAGCATCTKLAAHGPCDLIGLEVPQGSSTWEAYPATKRVDYLTYRAVFQALWQLDYVFNGHIIGIIYNAGEGGDNATQEFAYEVTAVSGTTVTLKGPNPKRLQLGSSAPNPDYGTGEGGALEITERFFALRPGAMLRFVGESVLRDKLSPYIVSISPPASNAATNVTFTVVVSANVSNARQPYDAAYPPADGKYYASVAFTEFHDAAWPNVQPPVEGQFAPREMTWTRAAAVSASGILELLDTDGDPTRIIPAGVDPATTPVLTVSAPGGDYTSTPVFIHEQVGYLDWATGLDVSAILAADATATDFTLTFWAGAVAADTDRLNHRGQCGNCQKDLTGSYSHHDGWRCTAVECTGFANFKRNCWQPGASKFNLADELGGFQSGNCSRPAASVENGAHPSAWWTSVAWILVQEFAGEAGTRNFHLERPANALPSMQSFLGAWAGGVPFQTVARRTEFSSPVMGQLVESVDGDGNDTFEIVFGAFAKRGVWTAGTTPDDGFLPATVGSWTGQEAYTGAGTAGTARMNQFPAGGIGARHLYEWTPVASCYGFQQRRRASESIGSGIDPAASDATLEPRLRARAGAIT